MVRSDSEVESADGSGGPSSKVASGKKAVEQLWRKLKADADLLSLKILSLDTVVCQNECSGHGSCHQATRSCMCDAFWMENFVRRSLMDGKSNCGEWKPGGSMISTTCQQCSAIVLCTALNHK